MRRLEGGVREGLRGCVEQGDEPGSLRHCLSSKENSSIGLVWTFAKGYQPYSFDNSESRNESVQDACSRALLGWPGMEQIVSLVRDYMQAEADAGYPLLRQIPSTR